MTDNAICQEIGKRIKEYRLNKNKSQKDLAECCGLSVTAVQGAENGKTTLQTIVRILRELKILESLDGFLPKVEIDPIVMAELEGKKRKNASKKRGG